MAQNLGGCGSMGYEFESDISPTAPGMGGGWWVVGVFCCRSGASCKVGLGCVRLGVISRHFLPVRHELSRHVVQRNSIMLVHFQVWLADVKS